MEEGNHKDEQRMAREGKGGKRGIGKRRRSNSVSQCRRIQTSATASADHLLGLHCQLSEEDPVPHTHHLTESSQQLSGKYGFHF